MRVMRGVGCDMIEVIGRCLMSNKKPEFFSPVVLDLEFSFAFLV
jgi:hypothetical protein